MTTQSPDLPPQPEDILTVQSVAVTGVCLSDQCRVSTSRFLLVKENGNSRVVCERCRKSKYALTEQALQRLMRTENAC